MTNLKFYSNLTNVKTTSVTVKGKTYLLSDPYIVGFLEGDGSIMISLFKKSTNKNGYQTRGIVTFYKTQEDKELLKAISLYLGCGTVKLNNKAKHNSNELQECIIKDQKSFVEKIRPLIKSNPAPPGDAAPSGWDQFQLKGLTTGIY